MKDIKIVFVCLTLVIVMLNSCSTTRKAQKSENAGAASAEIYKQKVVANNQTAKAVTGKMKVELMMGDKDISLGGSLKMMRDDVIQLSLSFLGMEVGRMEFTKNDVLVLDRVHRKYARVPYSKIDFLRSANLDFYALQALFWNEIFVPGKQNVTTALNDFRVSESGEHTLLILTTAPALDYSFLTKTSSALLDRTTVYSKDTRDQDNLECKYGNFVKLSGHSFPTSINLAFKGSKTYTLGLTLSGLNNDADWSTRTQVSSKYSEMNVNGLLDKLMVN